MNRKSKDTDVTRRDFVKTVGLAGIAVAGAGVTGAIAAPEPPAAAAPAGTTPRRKLGKTGVEVSILAWAACSTPSTTNCSSSRP